MLRRVFQSVERATNKLVMKVGAFREKKISVVVTEVTRKELLGKELHEALDASMEMFAHFMALINKGTKKYSRPMNERATECINEYLPSIANRTYEEAHFLRVKVFVARDDLVLDIVFYKLLERQPFGLLRFIFNKHGCLEGVICGTSGFVRHWDDSSLILSISGGKSDEFGKFAHRNKRHLLCFG